MTESGVDSFEDSRKSIEDMSEEENWNDKEKRTMENEV